MPAIKCSADPACWPSLHLLLNVKRHGLAAEAQIVPKGMITKSALLVGSRSEMAIADMMDQSLQSVHRFSPLATCRSLKSRLVHSAAYFRFRHAAVSQRMASQITRKANKLESSPPTPRPLPPSTHHHMNLELFDSSLRRVETLMILSCIHSLFDEELAKDCDLQWSCRASCEQDFRCNNCKSAVGVNHCYCGP